MSDSILNLIEDEMADHIGDMTQGDGYYFDWGSVNEPDVAKQIFPSAEIMLVNETCRDDTDGVWSQGYEQECIYTIRVRVALDNEEVTPLYEINKNLNQALDDLKKLFGKNHSLSDACETIMYVGMNRVVDMSNDIFRPRYMDTQWRVRYTQDRLNPAVNAE
jgi:hypothetical protein